MLAACCTTRSWGSEREKSVANVWTPNLVARVLLQDFLFVVLERRAESHEQRYPASFPNNSKGSGLNSESHLLLSHAGS